MRHQANLYPTHKTRALSFGSPQGSNPFYSRTELTITITTPSYVWNCYDTISWHRNIAMCKKALNVTHYIMKTCGVGKQDCALTFGLKNILLQSRVCLDILKLHHFLCCNLLKESHSNGTLYKKIKQQTKIHKRKQVKSQVWLVECEARGSRLLSYWKCVWWVLLIEETKGQRPAKKEWQTNM